MTANKPSIEQQRKLLERKIERARTKLRKSEEAFNDAQKFLELAQKNVYLARASKEELEAQLTRLEKNAFEMQRRTDLMLKKFADDADVLKQSKQPLVVSLGGVLKTILSFPSAAQLLPNLYEESIELLFINNKFPRIQLSVPNGMVKIVITTSKYYLLYWGGKKQAEWSALYSDLQQDKLVQMFSDKKYTLDSHLVAFEINAKEQRPGAIPIAVLSENSAPPNQKVAIYYYQPPALLLRELVNELTHTLNTAPILIGSMSIKRVLPRKSQRG